MGRGLQGFDDWDQPAPPVRIHGNTYLVGTCGISAILVTGSDGHVLIDGGTEKGAEVIAANIRALGFRLERRPFLLHSHEHLDHVGGIARLQQLTGAHAGRLGPRRDGVRHRHRRAPTTRRRDAQALRRRPTSAASSPTASTVRLGNLMLTAMTTPGHTPGALSWRWESCDGGVCRTMVYADSLTPVSRDDYRFSDHPAYLAAYRASIAKVAASRCEILLTPHPSASAMKERMTGAQAVVRPRGLPRLCRRARPRRSTSGWPRKRSEMSWRVTLACTRAEAEALPDSEDLFPFADDAAGDRRRRARPGAPRRLADPRLFRRPAVGRGPRRAGHARRRVDARDRAARRG